MAIVLPTTQVYQGELVVTAKDIAGAIRFRKDRNGFEKALRQVKHWTNSGLLKTITPRETGKGYARVYAYEPTILIAGVLQELALFGFTVDLMRPVADALYEDFEDGDANDMFFVAMTNEFDGYLILEFDVDERGKFGLPKLRMVNTGPDSDPLTGGGLTKTSSSIVINMAKLGDRIDWPIDEETEALFAAGKKAQT